MYKNSKRRVSDMKPPPRDLKIDRIEWDDLKTFLICMTSRSFRQAALETTLSTATLIRKIERLEKNLDVLLFHRVPEGIVPTNEAHAIVENARKMEGAFFDLVRNVNPQNDLSRGEVTIAVTEGLGSYWIMPRLVEFQRLHPQVVVNLLCAMDSVDVLRLEADLSIQYARPTNPDLIVKKLGRIHIYPFVAQSYVDIFGMPKTIEEMLEHRIVDQDSPQLDQRAWPNKLNIPSIEHMVSVRTNSSTATFYAVERGAGIGALPTYANAVEAPVIPVDIGVRHHMDIWLTYHRDIRKTERTKRVLDWTKEIFDPEIFPWFRDEFIHPSELVNIAPADAKINSMKNYFSAAPLIQYKDAKA